MTITVSGLGSGLNYDSWISALVAIKQADIDKVSAKVTKLQTQETALSKIETDYNNLLDSIQTFTDALSKDDVFGQKKATSSSDAVTATVTSSASAQNINVTVTSLATATTAQSSSSVASYVTGSTTVDDVAGGTLKAGTFSVYVGGKKSSIEIKSTDTMDNVVNALKGITGVSATLTDGKLSITSSGASTVTVGASSDTSNFGDVMSLTSSTKDGVTTYSSSKAIFDTDISAALTSSKFANADHTTSTAVTAGKFTIGSAEFTIDDSTTMTSLISSINGNVDAGVTAHWDSSAGKLVLEANDEGAVNINVESGTSNFTDLMGLTSGSALATGSQTLGTNAVLTINGTTITSSSNTVTSDISGVKGLTLKLNNTTSSTAKVAIAADTESAVTAITNFVSKLNMVISDTDSATTSVGTLYGESTLTMLRNKIRTLATASVAGLDGYKTLASIGITSGAIGTSVKTSTSALTIDTTALTAALTKDPNAVKALLVGTSTTTKNEDGTTTTTKTAGVLSKMETVVENATNSVDGYFVNREDNYEGQVSNLEKTKDKMDTKLVAYKSQLETKFALMDKIISNMQSQASVFDSYFNKSSSSS